MINYTIKELLENHFIDTTKILIRGMANNQPTIKLFQGTVSEALKLFENDPENSTYQNNKTFTFRNDCITYWDMLGKELIESYIIIYTIINRHNDITKQEDK